MGRLTWEKSQRNKGMLIFDRHDFTKKNNLQNLLSTGDAQYTVHTNAACSPSPHEMNSSQQKTSTATMLDLGKLRQTRSCFK